MFCSVCLVADTSNSSTKVSQIYYPAVSGLLSFVKLLFSFLFIVLYIVCKSFSFCFLHLSFRCARSDWSVHVCVSYGSSFSRRSPGPLLDEMYIYTSTYRNYHCHERMTNGSRKYILGNIIIYIWPYWWF